jgi:hypothetical protein
MQIIECQKADWYERWIQKDVGRTEEIYEKVGQDSWSLDQVWNMEHPEYKTEVTVTHPEHLVQYDYDWWIREWSHGLLNSFHSNLGTVCKPFQESIHDPFFNQH